jgi:putative ABC transport system permease protein
VIRNYFKTAFRYLQRNKLYSFVNILGLAVGIASCLLIGVYIKHELSFDRFHAKADRIVRVTWEYNFGDVVNKTALTGTKVGPQLQRTFPEVQAYTRTLKYPVVIAYKDKMFEEKRFLYADSAFFSMFSFPLISGDPKTVLDAPDKTVITQSAAKKYFGSEDPVGKTVKIGGSKDLVISGVAADAPHHSQIQFDFVTAFTFLNASKEEKWSEANYITYLQLDDKNKLGGLQSKMDSYMKKVGKEEMQLQGNNYMTFHLEPLTRVHLFSDLEGFEPNSDIVYIYVLAAVALLILLIACVNYTNLSTAQSAGRSAEVGIRKVLGAGKRQVFNQFICESFLLTSVSIIMALILSVILLPYFNQLSGKDLTSSAILNPLTLFVLIVLAILVTLTAGAYPSLVLSGSKVIKILKTGFTFTGSNGLRKTLIVFQFVISIFLMISTIIILQQLSYINNKDLGYDKEQVVVLPVDKKMQSAYVDIKNALANHPAVTSVAGAYEEPTDIGWSDGLSKGTTLNEAEQISVNALPVDENFVKTLGLHIIAGNDYSLTDVKQFDTSNGGQNLKYSYMLNETAAKALGWTAEEAIGKTIAKGREGKVKAVVKDFHFRSLHEAIGPLIIFMDNRMVNRLFVKIKGDIPAALAHLEATWKQRVSHRPFEYHFLDEDYDALYKAEQRTAGVFTTFSTLAILLACLGLFALTAYSMVRRTKEIGIRKILGATIADILVLVSKDFLKLVLIAMLIAVPIAWYAINKWLQSFTYKTSIHWWVFAMAGVATLLIAFITISLQAIKTALTNSVKNLRTE